MRTRNVHGDRRERDRSIQEHVDPETPAHHETSPAAFTEGHAQRELQKQRYTEMCRWKQRLREIQEIVGEKQKRYR